MISLNENMITDKGWNRSFLIYSQTGNGKETTLIESQHNECKTKCDSIREEVQNSDGGFYTGDEMQISLFPFSSFLFFALFF